MSTLSGIITPTNIPTASNTLTLTNKTIAYADNILTGVQPELVSGSNIKTIGGQSVLGSGDIVVGGGNGGATNNTSVSANVTLTSASDKVQRLSTTTFGITVSLPNATTIASTGGPVFIITNVGANSFELRDNSGTTLVVVQSNQTVCCNLISNATAAGTWSITNQSTYATALSNVLIGAVATVSTVNLGNYPDAVALTSTTSLAVWQADNSGPVWASVITNTAGVVTFGTPLQVSTASGESSVVTKLTDTTVFCGWVQSGALYGCVLTVSGTSVSKGSITSTDSSVGVCAAATLTSTSVLVCHTDSTGNAVGRVASISGTSVTFNGKATLSNATQNGSQFDLAAFSATNACLGWQNSSGSPAYLARAVLVNISGTTVSAGNQLSITTGSNNIFTLGVCPIDATRVLYTCRIGSSINQSVVISLSGGSIIANTVYNIGAFETLNRSLFSASSSLAYLTTSAGNFTPIEISGTTLIVGDAIRPIPVTAMNIGPVYLRMSGSTYPDLTFYGASGSPSVNAFVNYGNVVI